MVVSKVSLPLCLLCLVRVVAAMLVLEGGELVVHLVGAVLLSVALGMDEFKKGVLCSWKAGARTRETDTAVFYIDVENSGSNHTNCNNMTQYAGCSYSFIPLLVLIATYMYTVTYCNIV